MNDSPYSSSSIDSFIGSSSSLFNDNGGGYDVVGALNSSPSFNQRQQPMMSNYSPSNVVNNNSNTNNNLIQFKGNVSLVNSTRNNPFDESLYSTNPSSSSPSLNQSNNNNYNNNRSSTYPPSSPYSSYQPTYNNYNSNNYNNTLSNNYDTNNYNNYNYNINNNYNNNNGYHRLDEMERRLIAERQTIKLVQKLFNFIESSYLYRISIDYANQWRMKMSRNSSYVMNENLQTNPMESNRYYSNFNQSTAIYSRHESFIRSIIDSIISFKRTLLSSINSINNSNNNNTSSSIEYQDSKLAQDIANRIDRYTLQESKYNRFNKQYNNNNNQYNNSNNNNVNVMDRIKRVFNSILHIFKMIYYYYIKK